MGIGKRGRAAALLSVLLLTSRAFATVVAYDDAADTQYTPGIYHNFNGGFGLAAWSTNGFPFGANPSLQEFVATSTLNGPGGPDIDTSGVAWGNNAQPTGNTFLARRSLLSDLAVGGTYAISYDGGDVDGQETLSWGLNSKAMCQFYFNAAVASGHYQFYDALSNTTSDTGILQTFGGLRLTLTRDSASTYTFAAVRLSDSLSFNIGPLAYNTTAIPGIRTINLSNADGGAGGGHAMYLNAIEATALPEPAPAGAGAVLVASCRFVVRRRRPLRPPLHRR